MRIALTTPTGNIGSKVANRLLDRRDHTLVVLARNPSKVEPLVRRGAEIRKGSLQDESFVKAATRDADALFWVTPADYGATDLRAFQNQLGEVAASAVRSNEIARVVNLSSVGAHSPSGNGPVNGLHDVERILSDTAPAVVHLRPAYFFENYLSQLDAMRSQSSIFLPISGETRIPMIATTDIADAVIEWLCDPSWDGCVVQELHGPADLSFHEAAAQIASGLGRPVRHVQVEEAQARGFLEQAGLGEHVIPLLLEMFRSIDAGTMRPEQPRSDATTTATTLEQFSRQVMAPLISAGRAQGEA